MDQQSNPNSSSNSNLTAKTRDDSIQAAKKKLKTFRAKQAQITKRASNSAVSLGGSNTARNRASLILNQAAAQTVSNAIEQASDLAQAHSHSQSQSSNNGVNHQHVRTHSRSASRAGHAHARGHSRGGSISITAHGMANLVNFSLNQTAVAAANQSQSYQSNSARNSGSGILPTSTSMPAVTSSSSNNNNSRTSFIASTPSSHVRTHSRTGSRSALGRSRPASLIGLGQINSGEGKTLAVELPPDASLLGGMGRSEDWKDINNESVEGRRNSNRLSDNSRKSWKSNNNNLSAPNSRRTSERPLSSSSSISNKSASSNGTAIGNSNSTNHNSLPSPSRLSFNFNHNNVNTSPQPQTQSLSSNPRRQSRHGRQASVSTKRESMEIMGGLGFGAVESNHRNSKRFSSNRMSGIQSASVLFGGEPDSNGNRKSIRDWDMRGIQDVVEDDDEDRLTALEKLEGRSRSISPNPPMTLEEQFNYQDSSSQPQRSSLVQLPSFDDVHGDEGMDKRKSLTLLEKNELNTISSSSSQIGISDSNDGVSNSSSLSQSDSNSNNNNVNNKTRPMSMFGDVSPALEGLTTLMEEEEEEETSPIKERSCDSNPDSLDSLMEGEETSDALRRSRRLSLTPRPLKLKSRPASLFISPAMRATTSTFGSSSTNQMSGSSSLQGLSELSSPSLRRHSPSTTTTTTTAKSQGKDWSFSKAQQISIENKSIEELSPMTTKAFPSISSAPVMPSSNQQSVSENGEMTPPATSTSTPTPTGPKRMKPLRLSSYGSSGIVTPSTANDSPSSTSSVSGFNFPISTSASSSASSHGSQSSINSVTSNSTAKRNSLLLSGSLGRPSLEGREEINTPTSASSSSGISPIGMGMRRSSIIYKTSKSNDSNGNNSTFPPSESSSTGPFSTISPSSSSSSNSVSISNFNPNNLISSIVHEELKSKLFRETSLLEQSRNQVERLQKELQIENERSLKEYVELERRSLTVYNELENWSNEEKRNLGNRIESLENNLESQIQKLKDLEKERFEMEEQSKERLEEFESERESWRDDEIGWRNRCSDAEKGISKERLKFENEVRMNEILRKRIKTLTSTLEKSGIELPSEESSIGEEISIDLATILRSPALGSAGGPMRSPAIGSFENNSSGYFSPLNSGRSFSGGQGRSSQENSDTPATVKLLAEMRQQIFNLAGSLEHERKEHLKARKEADGLKEDLERNIASMKRNDNEEREFSSTLDEPLSENLCNDDSIASSSSIQNESGLIRRSGSNSRIDSNSSSNGNSGPRAKKHVFAYDSSMGSFGQSTGSNSIRSQNVSISMSASTDETGLEDESMVKVFDNQVLSKDQESISQQPPLSSSSSVASNLTIIPTSNSLNEMNSNGEDVVGLGVAMGGLQTLTEEEEADEESINTAQFKTLDDLESGGSSSIIENHQEEHNDSIDNKEEEIRDEFNDLEAGNGDYQEEDDIEEIVEEEQGSEESNLPPTPALDHDEHHRSTPPPSYRSSPSNHPNSSSSTSGLNENEFNHGSSGSGGSLESNGPVSPVQEELREENLDDYDEEEEAEEDEDDDDDYPQSSTPPGEPRAEFLREWSFSRAAAAVQSSKSKSSIKQKKSKKFKGKNLKTKDLIDIEDFFGIMIDHSLPALPPPPQALEMPPVYIEPSSNNSSYSFGSNFPFGMIGSNQSYDKAPRSSMRIASVSNPSSGFKRPPVARSAYVIESFESHQENGGNHSVSSNGSNNNNNNNSSGSSISSTHSSNSLSGNATISITNAAAGLSSKALSRMSLQGLTSAFTGLGGYLTSQSGAAVNVAANATRMCNNGELSPTNGLNQNGSIDWIEAKRRESSDNDGYFRNGLNEEDDLHPAVRKAIGSSYYNDDHHTSIHSNSSNASSNKIQRRFLEKSEIRKPIATPVWLLDFENATVGRGAGPLIQL